MSIELRSSVGSAAEPINGIEVPVTTLKLNAPIAPMNVAPPLLLRSLTVSVVVPSLTVSMSIAWLGAAEPTKRAAAATPANNVLFIAASPTFQITGRSRTEGASGRLLVVHRLRPASPKTLSQEEHSIDF